MGQVFSEHKAQRLAFSDGFKPVRLGQVVWDGQEGWFDLLVIDMVMDRLVRCLFCRPEVNHRKRSEVFWNCFKLKNRPYTPGRLLRELRPSHARFGQVRSSGIHRCVAITWDGQVYFGFC